MRLVKVMTLVGVLAFGGVAGAYAAITGGTVTRTHNRVTCTWHTELGGSSICQRADGRGYLVVVSQQLVMVKTAAGKVRFWRNQPVHSRGFGNLQDERVTFTETHNEVTCAWTAIGGGGVFCNKASNHGYVAGLTHTQVLVTNEASKLVYLVNQP